MQPTLALATPPGFLSEITALLAASAVIAYACHRLRVMPIVSFLVTGALVGPHALGLVTDEALIEAAAEVGVILLLFTIGIEFSLAKLARIKRLILVGGSLQVALVIAVVTGALALFGVDWRVGVFTGCLVALSSTAIVMKLLIDAGDTGSQEGQAALGVLIFQDLAVVAMVLLVPLLGGEAGGSVWGIALALAKAALIVALVLFAARRLMPPLLEAVARTCSQEIFLLSVVGICFGTAFLTSLAGVSLSLGAFLAGLVVSESRFSQLAFAEILPLQILFSATFFVSVGLLLDLGFLVQHPLLVLGVVVAVLAVKILTTTVSLKALGYGAGAASCAAILLAQVGEFSFVLERTGRGVGLAPAGFTDGGPETFIGATVLLMIATPFLYRLRDGLRRRTPAERLRRTAAPATPLGGDAGLHDHVIIAGLGDGARALAGVLRERGIPCVILTLSPDAAREAERGGLRVVRGNYTRRHELELAGIRAARLLVVADDDAETARRAVAAARALNADLAVLARVPLAFDVATLLEAGASEVVSSDEESLVRLVRRVLEAHDVSPSEIRHDEERLRSPGAVRQGAVAGRANVVPQSPVNRSTPVALTEKQRQAPGCAHAADTGEVTPSAAGCEECLNTNGTWLHLRICMTCGHVGCCDSSPGRHATRHHQATEHPIIKSLEPGDAWAWCYGDRVFL